MSTEPIFNMSVMKWHGHGLGSQDLKMEGERLLGVYLHRFQAKKPPTLVQGPLQAAEWKMGEGAKGDPRAGPGQRPDSPEGTVGQKPLCWSSLCLLY